MKASGGFGLGDKNKSAGVSRMHGSLPDVFFCYGNPAINNYRSHLASLYQPFEVLLAEVKTSDSLIQRKENR